METRELTCIGCPMGCQITVTMEGKEVLSLTGNTCQVGEQYARNEVADPKRTVTSTLRVQGGELPVVSVKTRPEIPKAKIGEVMEALGQIQVQAPVAIGDVLAADICGTGADIVATRAVGLARGGK